LPEAVRKSGQTTFRSIEVDGKQVDFSENLSNLHRAVYEKILAGRSFEANDARPAIELVRRIRDSVPNSQGGRA
jgi:UDP-N-acetyl-2-amino-2-deoxyglucuronate dehydrogenase